MHIKLACLLAGAVLAASCSNSTAEPIVHVFERASEASLTSIGDQLRPLTYVDTRTKADEEWFPIAVENLKVREGTPVGAERVESGDLLLGPGGGAWVRLVEVQPGEALVLTGEIDGSGLGVDYTPPFCNIGLVQFESMPSLERLGAVTTDPGLQADWTMSYPFDRGAAEPNLISVMGSETSAVAIVCLFTGLPGDEAARVRYSNLELRRAVPEDRRMGIVSQVAGEERYAELPIGEVELGMMTRPALCLLPGDTASFPIHFPREEARLEFFMGVPSANDDRWNPAAGSRVALEYQLILDGRSEPELQFARVLVSREFGEGRWIPVSADIPEAMRGKQGRVVYTVRRTSESSIPEPAVAIATPRVVPNLPERVGPNVVLISLDTLRADRLGCYGYDRDTSPNIDSFAEEARVFTDVWASSCYTLPSHMSMFTGQMPSMHTVTKPGFLRNPERSPLVAELLRERGYTTAAFTGGVFVDREFGFAAGFESYGAVDLVQLRDSAITDHRVDAVAGLTHELIAENDMEDLGHWIHDHRAESFFLFFHTYASHEFDPPEKHRRALGFEKSLSDDEESQGLIGGGGYHPSEEEVARLDDLYDGGVRFADEAVGQLLAQLDRSGIADNTIVIITADHGKEIGEHGIVGHGHALYEELLQIPLLIRVPDEVAGRGANREPGRDARPAMLVDIVPSILELVNIASPKNMQGESVFGTADPARVRLAEVENLAIKYALRRGSLKTIHNPLDTVALLENTVEEETFDLERDPAELEPLPTNPDRVVEISREFELLKTLSRALGETLESGQMSASTADQLRALGYVEEAKN